MQPARLILRVGITTQRLHGSAPIAIERGLKAEAEREERRKCAEAYKAEREVRERDRPKRRPKPGRAFPLDPIGPPQLIKQRDYELRRTQRTSE
jgi:hypothetical protein